LNKSSYRSLNDLVNLMTTNSTLQLTIAGHTDATGSTAANLDLSKRRANAVKAYLVKKGIPESRIKAIGYGSDLPVAPNTTKAGKSLNRRVEFKLE
jgi:outer membrane protein OmpA-like peptidoglycan-associated protein